jgi:hypothetical protein
MTQPTYIATGETINNTSVMIAEATPMDQLTRMLDAISQPKINFKYGIRLTDTRKRIAFILRNGAGYMVCIEGPEDYCMQTLSSLSEAEINSVIEHLKSK